MVDVRSGGSSQEVDMGNFMKGKGTHGLYYGKEATIYTS